MPLEWFAIRKKIYTHMHTLMHTVDLGEKVDMIFEFELFQRQISEIVFLHKHRH